MKQFKLTFLLIVLMSMVGAKAFAHDIEVANADGKTIYYTYMNNEMELAVSYRGSGWYEYSNEYSGVVNIPESVTYNGTIYPVTSIGKYAFYYCSGLTSVTIGNSVTSIGNFAFEGCIGLTSVTIPNSVTSIGRQAFDGCSGLTSVTIPNSVTSIGNNAFYYCSGLTSITIPNSVTSIGGSAFYGCAGLTEINVDENNTAYSSINGVLFNKSQTELIRYPGGKRGAYTIPNSVITIGRSAFSSCTGLTSVTIPNSVGSIGEYAFYKCSGLTSITIPNSVTSIGQSAFSSCSGLTSVTINSNTIMSKDYSYDSNMSHIFGRQVKSYTIGNSVTSIGQYAFWECTGLTSVTIGNSVTSIGRYAFSGCTGLTSVTIPNSVTSIGSSVFSGCTGLRSITIPNSVTSIGNGAFDGCSGLTFVTIGNSVTSIGNDAFYGCNLKKVIWLPSTPPSGYEKVRADVHYVPNNSYTSLLSSKTVYPYLTSIFEVDGVKYVLVSPSEKTCDAIDCVYDTSVEDIKIGNTVTYRGIAMTVKNVNSYLCYANPYIKNVEVEFNGSIGGYAFYGCTGLTSVTIGNSVTSIGDYAFRYCSGLTSVTIPNSVTSIGQSAFSSCSGLTSVTIPNSVTSIGNYAFSGCSGLTSVTINSNAIASMNYFSSSSLKDIFGGQVMQYVLGDDITSIGGYVFYQCSALTSLTIPNSVTSIGKYAFSGCHGLTSVTIPNSVTSIGDYAFIGCSSLTSVTIGNSVTNLGDYAFAGCTNITKLTSCATTPPICGTQALNDINKWDCTLVVPVGSKSAYQAADQWKDFFLIEESDVTAINRIYDDEAEGRIVGIYDLNGRKLERLQRGMNIVRMSDGTTKKVVIK